MRDVTNYLACCDYCGGDRTFVAGVCQSCKDELKPDVYCKNCGEGLQRTYFYQSNVQYVRRVGDRCWGRHCPACEAIIGDADVSECHACQGAGEVYSEAWFREWPSFSVRSRKRFPNASDESHREEFAKSYGPEWLRCECQPVNEGEVGK